MNKGKSDFSIVLTIEQTSRGITGLFILKKLVTFQNELEVITQTMFFLRGNTGCPI